MKRCGFIGRPSVHGVGCTIVALVMSMVLTSTATAQGGPDGEFRLARILGDRMVLQQHKPIRIWGWAPAGSTVKVTLTQDEASGAALVARAVEQGSRRAAAEPSSDEYGVTMRYVERNAPPAVSRNQSVTAGDDGRWMAELQPIAASFRPTWIAAENGDAVRVAAEVLIGEIWVCAGQSNMGWGGFNRKDREVASADFPGLRYVAWEDSWYKPLPDVRKRVEWRECSPKNAARFSAVPYLYGLFLHRYLKVPVGVINVARGGTLGQTWCMRDELDSVDHEIVRTVLTDYDAETARWDDPQQVSGIMAAWERACDAVKVEHTEKVAKAKADGKKEPRLRLPKKPGDPRSGWSPPAGLFNATVMPIRDLGVRGVLYYQGENNNFMRWTRYEHTFPHVPRSFRKAFRDEALPFGCISQPGWGNFGVDPELATVAEGYAIVRDIQRRALADDPNAAMIATYPTGNSYIHPAEKMPVAEYASRWALARVYGKMIVHRGNAYQRMVGKGSKLHLFFDSDPVVYDRWKHIEKNAAWQVIPCARQGNAPLEGFIIAGEDRRWYPAKAKQARLDGKWTIAVWSDLVADPVAVRYGWANWPTGNLVGRERLPLPTFRTDDWPIPEGMNYSEAAKKASEARLKVLKAQAAKQALDRKVRQMQVDLPKLESELHKGDVSAQVRSKLARLASTLEELQGSDWLPRGIKREYPELTDSIEALRKKVAALRDGLGPRPSDRED
ncbi:MAG: hypothetical protein HRU14_06945 [Planctomycetes bacterium]|nr:hypothetical protein [Planctomycetota bacterium]